ncbi:ribosome recycling factor domain-containing protein [Podospora aff. communis PSN243]|uniref:Ribosome recycling factor domain-containing protein n=1 Tax=Podospora aff. communis PSN243 TaxID=3040156 RepID=A0AAV9GTG0_9PEZI|nr:ribosome recycling factor domain-containing protein [Podospora aff. communis PSN243]
MNRLRTANALLRCNAVAHGAIPRTTRLAVATATPLRLQPTASRPFTTSRSLLKKDRGSKDDAKPSKKDKRGNSPSPSESSSSPSKETTPNDPFDFSDLTAAFDKHEKRYLDILTSVRSDGGFNVDTIGAVPVQPDRKSPQTFPLRELAAVAASGARRFTILAFDESSIKPIMSAIQNSEAFNQQPQRNEENPLELTLLLEPVRVEDLTKKAKEACQAWRERLRDETHKREKLHKKWKGDKTVSADDVVRLKDKMQKLQDERMKGIAAKEKQVLASIAKKG